MSDIMKKLDDMAAQERDDAPPYLDIKSKVFQRISAPANPSLSPYQWVSAVAGVAAAIFFFIALQQNDLSSEQLDLFNVPEMELTAVNDNQ